MIFRLNYLLFHVEIYFTVTEIVFLVVIGNGADNLTRITVRYAVGGNIARYYAARSYYRVIAYLNAGQNNRSCSYPHVVTDTYRNVILHCLNAEKGQEVWGDLPLR